MRQSRESMSWSRPAPYVPGGSRRCGWWPPFVAVLGEVGLGVGADVVVGRRARRGRRRGVPRRRGARWCAGTRPGRSRRCAASRRCGGGPVPRDGMGSRPVTRREASSQTGRTPSRARASATSSPAVRIALVPHRDRPTELRPVAVVGCSAPAEESASAWPVSQARRDRDGLGVDGVEVAAGRQDVDQAAQRRPAGPGRDEAAVQRVHGVVELVGGAGSRGDDLAGPRTPGRRRLLRWSSCRTAGRATTRCRVHSGVVHRLDERARQLSGPRLDPVGRPGRRADSSRPSASRSPGSARGAAPDLAGAQDGEHEVDPVRPPGPGPGRAARRGSGRP